MAHHIDTATAQKDKFGAGKNGFTRGNPQTGEQATALDDDYFDMIQEELIGIVEAANITPNKAKRDQLLTALKALFLDASLNGSDIADKSAFLSNLGLKSAAKADITGSVTESGGTPTGAIMERGSNANGQYIKFADGTQICWSLTGGSYQTSTLANAPIYNSQAVAMPYPATFSSQPVVSPASVKTGGSSAAWVTIIASDAVSTQVMAIAPEADSIYKLGYVAVGRWHG